MRNNCDSYEKLNPICDYDSDIQTTELCLKGLHRLQYPPDHIENPSANVSLFSDANSSDSSNAIILNSAKESILSTKRLENVLSL